MRWIKFKFIDIRDSLKREAFRRKYSSETVKSYLYCVDRFFSYCHKDPQKVSKQDIRSYLERLAIHRRLSGNSLNVHLNALKFFFEEVLRRNMRLDIKYSKRPKKIPICLTKEEFKKIIYNISNHKHKLIIAFMYSNGLRISELLNLKVKHLNLEKGYGFVRGGKGNKDRIFVVSERLRPVVLQLIINENLSQENYVFTSNRGRKYNKRTIRKIIDNSCKKAKIDKKISPHTFRHSFATHLIEQGSSVTEVQSLLGHKSPETTMIYLHAAAPNMTNVKSPFDNL